MHIANKDQDRGGSLSDLLEALGISGFKGVREIGFASVKRASFLGVWRDGAGVRFVDECRKKGVEVNFWEEWLR